MTGQRAAQRKNSPRQWGRPFGRAPREICPAISTHPHWGGDCTTTSRWQDVGAALYYVAACDEFEVLVSASLRSSKTILFEENVATVVNRWQHCVRFDRPEI